MALRVLSVLMIALGVAAVLIGLAVFLTGPAAAGHITELLFDQLHGAPSPLVDRYSATADSELRFYAPLWIAYGLVLIETARTLSRRLHWVPILAGVFFAGGVGRALAWLQTGAPHPAFLALMAIELSLPVVFVALWAAARRSLPP